MPIALGFTTFHGVILDGAYAQHFRYLERRLRKAIDKREPFSAQGELQRIKDFAGDVEEYRTIYEIVRKDADDRWHRNFATTWSDDIAALS